MKRTFYLFNPGIMERKDNTLKFTPVVANEDDEEINLNRSLEKFAFILSWNRAKSAYCVSIQML